MARPITEESMLKKRARHERDELKYAAQQEQTKERQRTHRLIQVGGAFDHFWKGVGREEGWLMAQFLHENIETYKKWRLKAKHGDLPPDV